MIALVLLTWVSFTIGWIIGRIVKGYEDDEIPVLFVEKRFGDDDVRIKVILGEWMRTNVPKEKRNRGVTISVYRSSYLMYFNHVQFNDIISPELLSIRYKNCSRRKCGSTRYLAIQYDKAERIDIYY